MAQQNDTAKEWVLYIYRYGHTIPLGCYPTVDEAKTHDWLEGADISWEKTHETGYIGIVKHLAMFPPSDARSMYYTINQDGRAMFDMLNPHNPARFKRHESWIDRMMNIRKQFGG